MIQYNLLKATCAVLYVQMNHDPAFNVISEKRETGRGRHCFFSALIAVLIIICSSAQGQIHQ